MATNFPGSLDTSTQQPTIASSDEMDDSGKEHDVVHTNHSGAIIALETKLGSTDSNPSSGAVLMGTGSGTSAWDTTPTFTGDVTIPDGDLILGSTAVTSTAAELNILDGSLDWTAWTPTLTNITLNSGTVNAHYARLGDVIFFEIEFLSASDTSFSGTSMQFDMPVNYGGELQYVGLGNGWVRPDGTSTIYPIDVIGFQSTDRIVPYYRQNFTSVQSISVRESLPATWNKSNGVLFMAGSYRA